MFRTGYVLSPLRDLVWFLAMPFLAVGAALAAREWLPGTAAASIALWITIPHHFATWLRTYGFEDERRRWLDRLVLGPIVIFGLTLAGMAYAPLTTLLLVTLWDHQHSVMQQHGFARIYDFKAGAGAPSTGRFDLWLGFALYGNLFLTAPFFTEYWIRELYLWGVPVNLAAVNFVHAASWTALAAFGVLYVGHVAWSLTKGYPLNPLKYLFLAGSYFLWYFVSWSAASFLMYHIAHKLMHGAQYMAIVHSYIQRKGERTGLARGLLSCVNGRGGAAFFLTMGLAYAVVYKLIIGGGLEEFGLGVVNFMLPYDDIRELGITGMGFDQGYALFSMSLIQSVAVIHYYFDSFIWKVRDQGTRSGL